MKRLQNVEAFCHIHTNWSFLWWLFELKLKEKYTQIKYSYGANSSEISLSNRKEFNALRLKRKQICPTTFGLLSHATKTKIRGQIQSNWHHMAFMYFCFNFSCMSTQTFRFSKLQTEMKSSVKRISFQRFTFNQLYWSKARIHSNKFASPSDIWASLSSCWAELLWCYSFEHQIISHNGFDYLQMNKSKNEMREP